MMIQDVINNLPPVPQITELLTPQYLRRTEDPRERKLGLAVESMRSHMTDEGWQVFSGLEYAGYELCGHALTHDVTSVEWMLNHLYPAVVVLQDKREWDVRPGDFRDAKAYFHHVQALRRRDDIFKLTILKDAHNRPNYHRDSAEEIGCHAWVVYYSPKIVKHLAPFVREEHLLRVYHTLDPRVVPAYSPDGRKGVLLSGAVSDAYPFRKRLTNSRGELYETAYLSHPGYHRHGSQTPGFLKDLTNYKVAICTASRYGYALRKIIEATAAGCIVVTNLPEDEILPKIDGNLVRVDSSISLQSLNDVLRSLCNDYIPEEQEYYALRAQEYYDFRVAGERLALDIAKMRVDYPSTRK